ncbi:MAG: hypothetical protein AAFP98_10115 [Pseudomonadota bacterium]
MAQFRRMKKMATAGATFAFALAIGYVMQYGDADASRFADGSGGQARTVLPAQVDTSPLLHAALMPPKLDTPVVQRVRQEETDVLRVDPSSVKLTALVSDSVVLSATDETEIEKVSDTPACDINLSAATADDAQILLTVQSPCRGEQPFEVLHSGMVFSAATDAFGQASVTVPALHINASVFITFADSSGATVSAVVPEVENISRVVLQWDSVAAEMIQPVDVESASLGTLQRLGDATDNSARYAEVFTVPASLNAGESLRALTVQAPVSDATCGQTLKGQSFHVFGGAEPTFKDFQITLPGCEHVGTFLELKKVLGGQTLLPE